MQLDELSRQRTQTVYRASALDRALPPMITIGLHGAGDFVTAVIVDGHIVERRQFDPISAQPAESIDQLTDRAAIAFAEMAPKKRPRIRDCVPGLC